MPFDLDVRDVKPQLTARERLIGLVPQLSEHDCASLLREAETWLRARRLLRERQDAERGTPAYMGPERLVGAERAEFLAGE